MNRRPSRFDARFNHGREDFLKRSSSPLYKGSIICGEDFTISFLKKRTLRMRQSWAVGFSVLELSKVIMGRLFYEEIQPAFGWQNVDVVFSDTDSLMLSIRGAGTADDAMAKLSHIMDFSNLPREHPLYDASRSKTPGYLKNECPTRPITRCAAVKTKSYYACTHDGACFENCECKVAAKGVLSSAKERLSFDDYASCIFSVRQQHVTQNTLMAKDHVNRMVRVTKVAFSSLDDKRYQCCEVHSTPYGSRLALYQERRGSCYACVRERCVQRGIAPPTLPTRE